MASSNFLLIVLLIFGTLVLNSLSRSLIDDDTKMIEIHEKWMAEHGRVYKDATEKQMRFKIFKDNVEFIESFNAQGNHKYWIGTNSFADLTNDEFKAMYLGFKPSLADMKPKKPVSSFRYENFTDIPTSWDWRTKGAVTPIKNQGQCGDCWAFSAVAATEGIHKLSTGKLLSLSEQQLTDCVTVDQGCKGGLMDDAFEYIIQNGGITTEANYPFQGSDGTCNSAEADDHAATITGYEDVPANSEEALLKAVANQPVSVAIDASGMSFQLYQGGVFTGDCGTKLDHGVTAIGFGTSNGMKYWIVKNSWGESWGEKGYIRMERDVSSKQGLCGIAMSSSYPTA